MKKIIIISGPTCAGKTLLSIDLAKNIDADIINADCFQVYKELNIGVDKIQEEEMGKIKHHLINNISVQDDWSIAHFLKEAKYIIEHSQKNIIVVGGSVLYIDALINNYDLNSFSRTDKYDSMSSLELIDKIKKINPDLINDSNKKNHRRLTRMYENLIQGKINQKNKSDFSYFHILINDSRENIYQKINFRTKKMFEKNWIKEVQELSKIFDFKSLKAFKAIGYQEILNNDFQIDDLLINKIQQKTRNYAKRQLTWCNNKFSFDFIYSSKIQFSLLEIMINNFLDGIEKPNSLYVHIPFCGSICTYCDFKRTLLIKKEAEIYISDLIIQLGAITNKLKTVYIGGGTPNCLDDDLLKKYLTTIKTKLDNEYEFTIELNPEYITDSQIDILKEAGINRISLGVQSLNDKILKTINRKHNSEMIYGKMELLTKHFDNISCDFIYNLPEMNFDDVDNIIKFINKYDVKHLSFYSLEIKEGSNLNQNAYKIDEDLEEEFMVLVQEKLSQTKLKRYEISNWAKEEKYFSQHNLNYWRLEQWYGIGNGAVGFHKNYYLSTHGNNLNYSYSIEKINEKRYFQDVIIMGLRLIEGLNLQRKKHYDAYMYFKKELEPFLTENDNRLKLKNIDLLNEVLIKII
ncbi:MAG: radical SAM family heme chaperone HemW [Mycoplasmoidaceae bacterium]